MALNLPETFNYEKRGRIAIMTVNRPRAMNAFTGEMLAAMDAAFADFKHRLRELTGRSWGVSMPHRFEKLGQYLRGWMGYFGISEYYRPIPELDEWLRRRVRMCYWKQWRLCRTKISHLLALGVDRRTAILTGAAARATGICLGQRPRKSG